MTIFEMGMLAFGAVVIAAVVALVIAHRKLSARLMALAEEQRALTEKIAAVREGNQLELLAIGQRVLEADKIVRRFSERLDGIENNSIADQPQYGQLQTLLAERAQTSEVSAAEIELLSLINRNRKLSS